MGLGLGMVMEMGMGLALGMAMEMGMVMGTEIVGMVMMTVAAEPAATRRLKC